MTTDEYHFTLFLYNSLENDSLNWVHEIKRIDGFAFIQWHRLTNNGVNITFEPMFERASLRSRFWEVIISSEGVCDKIRRIEGHGEMFIGYLMEIIQKEEEDVVPYMPVDDHRALILDCRAKLSGSLK